MADGQTLRNIASWLRESSAATAFTGAGISTESGIPDFRSPGGVWEKYQPVYFDDFMASAESRHEYWRQKCEAHREFADSQPNIGHRVLAQWEQAGRLQAVITQNIDGLHQLAGSQNVLELHGTVREVACMDCGKRLEVEPLVQRFLNTDVVPPCPECDGRLKHATVSFGQALPADVLQQSAQAARQCDLFFALGSSLVVEPAASLPRIAKQNGARLVIINRDSTDQDSSADAVLHAPLGESLQSIDALLGRSTV